jgi:hypothetical protein
VDIHPARNQQTPSGRFELHHLLYDVLTLNEGREPGFIERPEGRTLNERKTDDLAVAARLAVSLRAYPV